MGVKKSNKSEVPKFFGHQLRLFGKFTNANIFGRSLGQSKPEKDRTEYGEETESFVSYNDEIQISYNLTKQPIDQVIAIFPTLALYFSIEFGKI